MKKEDLKFLVSPFLDCYDYVREDLKAVAPEFALWVLFIFGFAMLVGWFVR